MFTRVSLRSLRTALWPYLWKRKYHLIACALILLWVLPYFTTGSKVEWGDFSYYSQMHEAIRINIIDYHQFPWWNPWLAGGLPLYANPQAGVFSLQTLFVLLVGGSLGLKLALVVYTFAGYASMFVLARRYFKIDAPIAAALGLAWIFCAFFVSHLPSHFTFQWFMLGPLFIYLALTIRSIKGGALLGVLLALNALSAFHYAFIHALTLVGIILAARIIADGRHRLLLIKSGLVAFGIMTVLAGHRLLLTLENVSDFPRNLIDPATTVANSALSFILPFSKAHHLWFVLYPKVHYGWGEQTAAFGVVFIVAVVVSLLFYAYTFQRDRLKTVYTKTGGAVLLWAVGFFVIGLGAFAAWAPWNILQEIPPFSFTRVSPRWFLWVVLALLIFVGLTATKATKGSMQRFTLITLIYVGVAELFLLNVGYQRNVLNQPVIEPSQRTSFYTFQQQLQFGETLQLYDNKGKLPNDGNMPHFYRDYEATLFNIGTIQANDSLVDLNTKPTPRCSWVSRGCELVLSKNAKVTTWTPNKIVLERTANGPIKLNFNNSNYYLINGKRDMSVKVAEPYKEFVVREPDSTKKITIEVKPTLTPTRVKNTLRDISSGKE